MFKKVIPSVLCFILIFSLAVSPALALSPTAQTDDGGDVKALMYKGSYLPVTGSKGDWYSVVYQGTQGFIHSGNVDYAITESGKYGTTGTIIGIGVRFYQEPDTGSKVLAHLSSGASLEVLGLSGDWVKLRSDGGVLGYVRSDSISLSAAGNVLVSNYDARGAEIIATAKLYMGVPYVWGGISPYGFDCSGFVNYIYAAHGYSLWRVTQDMYNYDGIHVDKDSLRAGDILCFGYGPGSVTHVGLYIGSGEFIHASSGSGKVVVSELSGYYAKMYVGAKRILE